MCKDVYALAKAQRPGLEDLTSRIRFEGGVSSSAPSCAAVSGGATIDTTAEAAETDPENGDLEDIMKQLEDLDNSTEVAEDADAALGDGVEAAAKSLVAAADAIQCNCPRCVGLALLENCVLEISDVEAGNPDAPIPPPRQLFKRPAKAMKAKSRHPFPKKNVGRPILKDEQVAEAG